MPAVVEAYPKTCGAGIALSIPLSVSGPFIGCSKPLSMALGGIGVYGVLTTTMLGLLPVRSVGRGRIVQVLTGAAVAGGLFYKIGQKFLSTESDPNDPTPPEPVFAATGALLASFTIPFAQNLYQIGKNAICGNRDQTVDPHTDSDSSDYHPIEPQP